MDKWTEEGDEEQREKESTEVQGRGDALGLSPYFLSPHPPRQQRARDWEEKKDKQTACVIWCPIR